MRTCAAICVTLAAVVFGCRSDRAPSVTLVVDANRNQKAVFSPKAAFAEYVAITDSRHELRLTLASFEATCDDIRPAKADETIVTVLLLSPPSSPPATGEYGFGETPDLQKPVGQRLAIPKAQHAGRSWLFQPGGGVKLTAVSLEPHGLVQGMLDLSYPGDADHPASRIEGRFSAWICRASPAPTR